MNLNKLLKSGLVSILILALGLVLLLTVNFNKSFDFTGGTVVTLNIRDYEVQEAVEKVNTALSENNLVASYLVEGENENGTCLIIKYQIFEDVNTVNENFENDLYESFGYDQSDMLEESYILMQTHTSPELGMEVFLKAFIAVLAGLVAVAVYMFARHNLTSGFTMIAVAILDLGLMMALTLITRIPVNGYFVIAILGTALFSITLSFIKLNAFNKDAKDENYIKLNNTEITNISNKEENAKIFKISLALIVALLISAVLLDAIGIAVISLILGIFACVFSSRFVTPELWALAFKRRTKKPKNTSKSAIKDMAVEPVWSESKNED
ncbi:MAG: hypothetical protein PHR96_02495 [Clostridia bacterium]|nr:hypothetical protein [Clostridia bacterium]